jgi:serine/threonine-protein kinase RsbW
MAGLDIRESVTVAGRAERARVARAFVGGMLGPGHPCGDDAALLVSELFGNSVRHSRSGAAAGRSRSRSARGTVFVRVEVTDRGAPEVPELCPAGREAEADRGLSSLRASRRGGGGGSIASGR